jgi:hypothetical protein
VSLAAQWRTTFVKWDIGQLSSIKRPNLLLELLARLEAFLLGNGMISVFKLCSIYIIHLHEPFYWIIVLTTMQMI